VTSRYDQEGEKISARSTHLVVTGVDAHALYRRLEDVWPALRAFEWTWDEERRRTAFREVRPTSLPPETGSLRTIDHYLPDPGSAFEPGICGWRNADLPSRRFRTMLAAGGVLDLSHLPENQRIVASKNPELQALLAEVYGHDLRIPVAGSGGQVDAYFKVGDEDTRRFVQEVMSTARRGMSNRYRWQDLLTGALLQESGGDVRWAGEDTVRQCLERDDFFAWIFYDPDRKRWTGVKALPREPRRRRSARAALGPA
jgi:hypothetical protein